MSSALFRRPGRVVAHLVHRDRLELEPVDRLALVRPCLLGAPGEEDDLLGREQRHPRADLDQLALGALVAQHVGHSHPVEGAWRGARRDVEVRVEVEVDEPDAVGALDVPGDGADADGAVATQDDGDLLGEDRFHHPRRGVVDDLDDPGQVLSVRALAVGAPAPALAIAVVGDLDAGIAKQLD